VSVGVPDNDEQGLAFDHIGILVPELEAGCTTLRKLLGTLQWTRRFDDGRLRVSVRFARDNAGIVYEIIAPLGDHSPVSNSLKSRAALLNQIAYRTRSLAASVTDLRRARAVPVGAPAPALAFGGAPVQFMMTPLGFLIELIETDRVVHEFS
jgi:methylmalonyl-CoA/ethylmalonyl-CoA epimerase